MNKPLNISLVQADLSTDIKKNLSLFNKLLKQIRYTDIILLPEMFNTSFLPEETSLSETMNGRTINWMKKVSQERSCSISGTLMIKDGSHVYNRLVWISNTGDLFSYDKRHLFSLAKENKFLKKGNKRLIVEHKGWKICPLICYDLRFPVFSRNNIDYDILIYLSNWPQKRIEAWNTLLKARAIENQCYTIGINRVGKDKKGVLYNGYSQVFDSFGKKLHNLKNKEQVGSILLDKEHIDREKSKFNFLKDRDNFTIH